MNSTIFHLITGGTPGLKNDAEIIYKVLQGKYPVSMNVLNRGNLHLPHKYLALYLRKPFTKRKNVMLFFENLSRSWMGCSDSAILIPNQEWIRPLTTQLIPKCREIWCKTHYAERIFLEQGLPVRHIGFTSKDIYLPEATKDYSACVHIAGRSELKGTTTLLKVWKRHPEWPRLTVIGRHHYLLRHSAPNINVVTDFLSHSTLQILMNEAGIHICPSETEGFGHYINEALSCKSTVITTQAPPMSELVNESFGFLAKFEKRSPAGYGERFKVEIECLENTISRALSLTEQEKAEMGERARISFLARKMQFEENLMQAAIDLTQN